MMQKLANMPWSLVLLIALGWLAAWRLALRVAMWHALRPVNDSVQGTHYIMYRLTASAMLVYFGLPIALVLLRAIASRTTR
jgi:hypothetical protein